MNRCIVVYCTVHPWRINADAIIILIYICRNIYICWNDLSFCFVYLLSSQIISSGFFSSVLTMLKKIHEFFNHKINWKLQQQQLLTNTCPNYATKLIFELVYIKAFTGSSPNSIILVSFGANARASVYYNILIYNSLYLHPMKTRGIPPEIVIRLIVCYVHP